MQRLWFFSKHLGPTCQYEFCDAKCNKKQKVSFVSQFQSCRCSSRKRSHTYRPEKFVWHHFGHWDLCLCMFFSPKTHKNFTFWKTCQNFLCLLLPIKWPWKNKLLCQRTKIYWGCAKARAETPLDFNPLIQSVISILY